MGVLVGVGVNVGVLVGVGVSVGVFVGVGVNVSVTKHTNLARIENAVISAIGLSVTAASGSEKEKVESVATAKAGYSSGNIGVGGAIAVHVASAKTKALIYSTASATLQDGGSLTVKATSYERFATEASSVNAPPAAAAGTVPGIGTTPATGTGSSSGAQVGVGAGIAVGVFGVDVVAAIEDNTSILMTDPQTDSLDSVSVEAKHVLSESLSAKAGSAGGISVTPVLSLLISGADVQS